MPLRTIYLLLLLVLTRRAHTSAINRRAIRVRLEK